MSAIASRSRIRRLLAPGPLWLAAPGSAFLVVFLLMPVLRLLALSVEDADTGALTAHQYERLFNAGVYLRVLGITFRFAGSTALLSVILGYPVAYWLALQPDVRRARLALLVLVPFWTSYLVKTFAWMVLLGRTGIVNAAAVSLGLVGRPLSLINNDFGVMVGMVHAMLPLAVLTMLPVMSGMDARLGPVAGTLGAGAARRFWLVTFPLSLPGLAAAGLLTFISSLGFFIVPALLGGRQQTMLAQLVITQVQQVLDWSFAGALSALLIVTTLAACWAYDRAFGLSGLAGDADVPPGRGGTMRTIGLALLERVGEGFTAVGRATNAAVGLRVPRLALPIYVGLVLSFLVVPTIIVIPMAFSVSSFLSFPPPGYSFRWFEAYFGSDVWIGATLRSFGVAFATAVSATLMGGAAALGLVRSRARWRGAVFAFFLTPMIVPPIVIAVGLFYLFAQIGLVATDVGLVIGHTVLAIPFALVAVSAVLKGYDWQLDQVAATLGANRPRVLWLVTMPLVQGGLLAAFLFAFVTSFDELTIALFVSGGVKTTLPKQMWDDMVLQLNPTLAAVSVVVLFTITMSLLLAERLRRRP